MKTTVGFMVMALLLGTAHASGHKKIDEAKEHYFNGERAYRLGEFDRAIVEFKKSYDINPVPGILFNLGQSYYKNNDLKSAEHIFRQFIEESHDLVHSRVNL